MTSGTSARRFVEPLARYLGPVLLCLVASCQIHWAAGRELLTPARGGGFGLFSTVDKLGDRQVRMFLVGPSGTAKVGMPARPEVVRRMKTVAALPTEANLRETVAWMGWFGRIVESDGEPPFPTARVEVWKRSFDAQTLEASRELVAEIRVERGR